MKKSIQILPFICIIALALSACEKESLHYQEREVQEETKEVASPESDDYVYTVPLAEIEDELISLTDPLNSSLLLEDYPEATVSLKPISGSYIEITIQPHGNGSIYPPNPARVVCSGFIGATFAKCCGDYLKANPSGCLVVTYDASSKTWSADNEGC